MASFIVAGLALALGAETERGATAFAARQADGHLPIAKSRCAAFGPLATAPARRGTRNEIGLTADGIANKSSPARNAGSRQ